MAISEARQLITIVELWRTDRVIYALYFSTPYFKREASVLDERMLITH